MKSYVTQKQLTLVGKAREIREYLRQAAIQMNDDATVAAWLAQRTTVIAKAADAQLKAV